MFILKIFILLISFLGGIVVNHWIARKVFSTKTEIKEREILLHGLVISLVINGVVGTYLAVFKIFNLYVFAAVFVVLICLLSKDFYCTIKAISTSAHELYKNICRLNVLTIAAACLTSTLFVILAALCFIPTQNPDAWAFHLPIAASIINNSGFIYPIIDSIHYANQPSFMSVLFAQMMSLNAHFALAALVNVLLYLFMFIALASVWDNLGLALCIILALVATNVSFATGAPTPLTDLSRSCLSVLGITYLALYRDRKVPYYAGLAAMCIGASIAAKYTELLSLSIMGVMLASELKSLEGRQLILKCALIISIISIFWYAKNLILFKNPIYPFIFGHPGLSDEWMKDYMVEMTTPFDPAHRHFVHNLFTRQGWIDFFSVSWTWFFQESFIAKICLAICILGTVIYPRLILPMFGCSIFLFIFWYVVMFNHIRWAKPAYLLLYITACYVLLNFFERYANEKRKKLFNLLSLHFNKTKLIFISALASLIIVLLLVLNTKQLIAEKMTSKWSIGRTADLIFAVFKPGGIVQYLAKTREGYSIYQYIVRNELTHVFQPFHEAHEMYAKIYNQVADGNWFIDNEQLLSYDSQAFIERNNIEYFILRPHLPEIVAERIGYKKIKRAYSVIDDLMIGAELVLEDESGWMLYRVQRRSINK